MGAVCEEDGETVRGMGCEVEQGICEAHQTTMFGGSAEGGAVKG